MKEVTTEKREFEGKKSDGPPLFLEQESSRMSYVWKKSIIVTYLEYYG